MHQHWEGNTSLELRRVRGYEQLTRTSVSAASVATGSTLLQLRMCVGP